VSTLLDLQDAFTELERRAPVSTSTAIVNSCCPPGPNDVGVDPIRTVWGWRWATKVGLIVWAITRVAFWTFGLIVVRTVPSAQHRNGGLPALDWPFQVYFDFDSGWFLTIATHGYFPAAGKSPLTPAFLPAYPLAGRYLATLLGLGSPTRADYFAGLALTSLLGSAVAAILLCKLTLDVATPTVAVLAVVILLAGPYSVFLMASYSESLFLALAMGAWITARNRRWMAAGLLAGAATLVRVNGLFLDAGLAMMVLRTSRSGNTPTTSQLAPLAFSPLAILGYFGWLQRHTGSWTTWFSVQQEGWGRTTVWPTTALADSVGRIADAHGAARFQSVLEVVFAAGFIAATTSLATRRDWPAAVYVGLTAASLLTSHHYLSVPRSMLTCFPITIVVAEKSSVVAPRGRAVTCLVTAACVILLVANTTTFLSARWTG
jgi:hypothetical protein